MSFWHDPFAMRRAAAALLTLAAAVLVAGALAWVAQRPYFDLRRIEVRGDLRHVSQASVRAALAGRLDGNFFTLSLDSARRVFESVPWVAAASVRRAWPDRLLVQLREHRALGVWEDGQLLSEAGVLFTANPAEAEAWGPLPDFSGPARLAPQLAQRWPQWVRALAPLALEPVAVEVSERGSWSLRTAQGQTLELGRDEPDGAIAQRLAQVVASYPLVVARLATQPTRIDARYPNGFAVAAESPLPHD